MSDVHQAIKADPPHPLNTGPAHIAFLTSVMRIQDIMLSGHRSFQKRVSHVVDWLQYFAAPLTKSWSGFC